MPIPFHLSLCRSSLLIALIVWPPPSGTTAHAELLPTASPAVALDPPLPGGSLLRWGWSASKAGTAYAASSSTRRAIASPSCVHG